MDVLATEQVFFLSGCWAAGVEGQKFSSSFGRWTSMKFTFCIFLNPGYQPSIFTSINFKYLSRCACHSPLMNLRPTSIARQKIPFEPRFWLWDFGTLSCLLLLLDWCPWRYTLFSLYQAPTGCEAFVSSLIFPNARFLLGRVRDSRAFQKYCISNRVAPVCVNSSIRTWLWGSLFIGVPHSQPRSGMPSKEGGGPLNKLLSGGDTSTR